MVGAARTLSRLALYFGEGRAHTIGAQRIYSQTCETD